MTDHETLRELSAGFVLGALDPDDRRRFEAHLAECAECRREVASFAPLPGLLSRAEGLAAEPLPSEVADRAAARARSEWAALSRSRRRWRVLAAAAALAAAVVAVATLLPDGEDRPGTSLALEPGTVTGEIVIDARPWGTALHIDLAGLPHRDRYVAWVIDASGDRQQAATWGPTPAGIAILDGASSIPTDRVVSVAVGGAGEPDPLVTGVAASG